MYERSHQRCVRYDRRSGSSEAFLLQAPARGTAADDVAHGDGPAQTRSGATGTRGEGIQPPASTGGHLVHHYLEEGCCELSRDPLFSFYAKILS